MVGDSELFNKPSVCDFCFLFESAFRLTLTTGAYFLADFRGVICIRERSGSGCNFWIYPVLSLDLFKDPTVKRFYAK